jgi:hypothetical protein
MSVCSRGRALAALAVLVALPAALAGSSPPSPGLVDLDEVVEPPAAAAAPSPATRGYSPYAGRTYPSRVYFGDTHLHTSNSGDAFMGGDRLGPEQAYRFARGEEVVSSTGVPAKLARPLDFLVITDHAEGLGLMAEVADSNPAFRGEPTLDRWARMMKGGMAEAAKAANEVVVAQSSNTLPPLLKDPQVVGPVMRSVWTQSTALAEKYNEPGRFTALIGYEWTSVPGGNNLHRNVIFRDGKSRADQVFPFSAWNSEDPEKLWEWMEGYEQRTGGRLLLEPRFEGLPGREVERLFGREFAASLARLQPGGWVGPLRSGYGEHLVRLERREPGALPPLAEVREAVERDWRQDQRQQAREADHRRWLSRYRVVTPLSR